MRIINYLLFKKVCTNQLSLELIPTGRYVVQIPSCQGVIFGMNVVKIAIRKVSKGVCHNNQRPSKIYICLPTASTFRPDSKITSIKLQAIEYCSRSVLINIMVGIKK